ncbi:MAG: cyclopropane-fatty-acyl-phospholipid synthase family protein [Ornithinimicrobium sp.]
MGRLPSHTDGRGKRSEALAKPMLRLFEELADDIRIEVYDGTEFGDPNAAVTIKICSSDFLARVIRGRGSELAFSRAYVAGDIEVEGDIYAVLALRNKLVDVSIDLGLVRDTARALGIRGATDLRRLWSLPVPAEEARVHGFLHSRRRDAQAISAHYDVSNDFYRLFLGSTMTYSCALFHDSADSLDQAQSNKYDLICRKLGLKRGMRLLDLGCGWGGMVLHAATHYGVTAVGVTISREQQQLARQRVAEGGLEDQIDIRLQDYRDIEGGPFDAISSIGMFEHVGMSRLAVYFEKVNDLLVPGGRFLNHAINRPVDRRRGRIDPNGFMSRYAFPDGELLEVGQIASAINRSGLEVRHIESLREHYALTLREWVRRLEQNWDEALRLTSPERARVWRLYMAVSALGFETNTLNVTQILATKTWDGASGVELRPEW